MKSLWVIKYNFLTGFLLSLLVSVAIFPFVNLGGKYHLSVLENIRQDPNDIFLYKDIDHDGTSDLLIVYRNLEGRSAIILKKEGRILFQWNLHGKMTTGDFLYTGDYNGDGIDEIYFFTYSHDSIFLSAYDVAANKPFFAPLFLTKFKYFNGNYDVEIHDPQFHDLRHNGNKELIFTVFGAFSKSVRKVFAVDLKNRTIRSTPESGTTIRDELNFVDINGDGTDEIMGEIPSLGNFSPDYPTSDAYMWFFVYNAALQYQFKPRKTGHFPGLVYVYPFVTKTKNLLAIFSEHTGISDSSFLALSDGTGKILRYRNIPFNKKSGNQYKFKVFPPGEKYRMALYHGNGLVEYFNEKLKRIKTNQSVPFNSPFYPFDLDNDGHKEEVYFGLDMDHLVISRYDFTDPVSVKFNGEVSPYYFSVRWVDKKPQALCLNLVNRFYEFQYRKNSFYTFRYLVYAGFFLSIFLIISLIGFFYQRPLKRKYNAKKRIRENQLLAIELQLNPHFLLNILNSIGSLYEKKETELARIYMGKYSKMLRDTLLASGQIATSLEQELNFVQNYLDLEQFRLSNHFDYTVKCDLKTSAIQIPRLLIYTFVENALKDGLYPILGKEPAHIEISCTEKEAYQLIEVTDNGIGRKEAGKREKHSTGKGLEILNETLRLYRTIFQQKISFKIRNLNSGSRNPGTKITVFIQKLSIGRKIK